jgi:hypothetical protein
MLPFINFVYNASQFGRLRSRMLGAGLVPDKLAKY